MSQLILKYNKISLSIDTIRLSITNRHSAAVFENISTVQPFKTIILTSFQVLIIQPPKFRGISWLYMTKIS